MERSEFRLVNRHRVAIAKVIFLAIALISGAGLFGKISLLQRFVPLPYRVLLGVLLCGILLPLTWKLSLRWREPLAGLVLLGIVVVSLFVYPRVQLLQQIGHGSDQSTCVIVAAQGLADGHWPYDRSLMWSHNPMSCGPGWVALQMPATILASYRWNMLVVWVMALLMLRMTFSRSAVAGVVCLTGLEVAVWVSASDGTDFLTFGILIAALFAISQEQGRFDWLVLFVMALAVQFRFPMVILPVLLLPATRISRAVMVSCFAFLCHLGFLLWNPTSYIGDGPLHLFYKVSHTHLITAGRGISAAEVSVGFGVLLAAAIVVRLRWPGAWLGLAYLVLLLGLPAIIDLIAKARIRSLSVALGSWEGANWLTGCLPMSILLLLDVTKNLGHPFTKSAPEQITS